MLQFVLFSKIRDWEGLFLHVKGNWSFEINKNIFLKKKFFKCLKSLSVAESLFYSIIIYHMFTHENCIILIITSMNFEIYTFPPFRRCRWKIQNFGYNSELMNFYTNECTKLTMINVYFIGSKLSTF